MARSSLCRVRQVFFIRHGESRWNEAQAKRDVFQMVSHVDHPLNEHGYRQVTSVFPSGLHPVFSLNRVMHLATQLLIVFRRPTLKRRSLLLSKTPMASCPPRLLKPRRFERWSQPKRSGRRRSPAQYKPPSLPCRFATVAQCVLSSTALSTCQHPHWFIWLVVGRAAFDARCSFYSLEPAPV